MATLNDVISCYNELADEVNGHTASIETLTARLADVPTSTAMASLTAKLSQLEARLDELVQEHDVMMDTISSLLAAPAQTVSEEETEGTVELKRVGKKTVSEEEVELKRVEKPAPALKRVGKKAAQTVVEETPKPTVVEEEKTVAVEEPAPKPTVEEKTEAPAPTEAIAALKRASASKTVAPKPKTTVTEIQKRAFARQYMVEHGAKVEDLRNPERINETIASEEFTAWMNAR